MNETDPTTKTVNVNEEQLVGALKWLLASHKTRGSFSAYMDALIMLATVDEDQAKLAAGYLHTGDYETDQIRDNVVEAVAHYMGWAEEDIVHPDLCSGRCGQNPDQIKENSYEITDAVREAVNDQTGRWCIGCLERSLGRQLTPGDFDWSNEINTDSEYDRSERLTDRMNY